MAGAAHHYVMANVGLELFAASKVAHHYIVANVTTDTPTPHLWMLLPNEASPGEFVDLIGTNLTGGAQMRQGTTWIDIDADAPVSVAATGDETTAGREISPTVVDPAHKRVTVTVPAWARYPGHELRGL